MVEARGLAHLAALGLVSMMLRCVIVRAVEFGRPYRDAQDRQLWREHLSRRYLAHHELESVIVIIIISIVVVI